ncbi:tetratricopeptide repeat protein [uncultured Reyranella sp.]|uniref:tetratricopeptide repeat protein n=1 Tax=uncultured Reyranella sp. TaxID=735512 RepID=UPI00338D3E06
MIEACTAFIAEHPQRGPVLARAYTWRGRAYADVDEPDRAIEDLNQAIGIEPSTTAFELRGRAYWRKGDAERALSDYQVPCRSSVICSPCWA